jgi:hypothetical protein
MNIAQIACVFVIVASAVIALYELYLVFNTDGARGKLFALAATAFWAATSGHYASVIGWLPSLLDNHMRAYSLWALTALFLVLAFAVKFAKNEQNRRLLRPVLGAMFVANVLILVFYRLS